MVYFIEAVGAGLVKIGFTDGNPEDRLKQLQTGSAHPLRLRVTTPGGLDEERTCHQRFAHLRENGEWFRLTMEMEVYIAMIGFIFPKIVEIAGRMALLQRAVTDIGNNADAVYDSFEAALGDISRLQSDVQNLKGDAIASAFGGE